MEERNLRKHSKSEIMFDNLLFIGSHLWVIGHQLYKIALSEGDEGAEKISKIWPPKKSVLLDGGQERLGEDVPSAPHVRYILDILSIQELSSGLWELMWKILRKGIFFLRKPYFSCILSFFLSTPRSRKEYVL